MTKYLFSTLVAAAAMAVPAFADVELIASWDFSQATAVETETEGVYTIAATDGTTSIQITTGSTLNEETGQLEISATDTSNTEANRAHETTIDISSANVTAAEGISIVMTIESWDFIGGNSGHYILSSIANSKQYDYAAIGGTVPGGSANTELSGNGTLNTYFMGGGSTTGAGNIDGVDRTSGTISFSEGTATTITMTFIGDVMTIYQDGEYVMQASIGSSTYDAAATIVGVAIGSWDSAASESGGSVGNEPNLNISSLEIWRGDVTTLPEPSMFGLMFGLGAIGLVATRRRRRA